MIHLNSLKYATRAFHCTLVVGMGVARVASSQALAPPTAFVDVAVIPMDTERVLPHQTVIVEGGRITAMGSIRNTRVPSGATRIDGRGKFLMPGLADMHTHLQTFDSATVEQVLVMFLANGVTTIRNMDYLHAPLYMLGWAMQKLEGASLLHFRKRVAAGELLGPRVYTSGPWRAPTHDTTILAMLKPYTETQADVDRLIDSYKAAGYDFVKVHDEDSVRYSYVVNAARRVGLPVAGHVPAHVPLAVALGAHQASIEHLTGYFETIRSLNGIAPLVSATKHANVWNCPTLVMEAYNAHEITRDSMARWPEARYFSSAAIAIRDSLRRYDAQHPTETERAFRLLAAQRQLVKTLQDSGAGLLLGTDSPAGATMPGFTVHRELAALVRAGLTPYQALAAGTRNTAVYLGTSSTAGTVEVGKRADFLLLDANPLDDIRNTTRQTGVMIDGRWFMRADLNKRLDKYVGTMTYDWGYVH